MKAFLSFILLLFSFPLFGQIDQFLADSLLRMAIKDKVVRMSVDSAFKKYGKSSPEWQKAWNELLAADEAHNIALKKITASLKKYPSRDIAGEEGAHDFWVLMLHQDADTAFQKQVLELMEKAHEVHMVEPNDYAYLVDRIKINTGKKQIYGTQCYYDTEKKAYVPRPIANPGSVDERRKMLELPPLSIYLKILNDPDKKKY